MEKPGRNSPHLMEANNSTSPLRFSAKSKVPELLQINFGMISLGRRARAYTQADLANISNISQSRISKIEMGVDTPSENEIKRIAEALQFPSTFFCAYIDQISPDVIYFRKRKAIPKKRLQQHDALMSIIKYQVSKLLESVEIIDNRVRHFSQNHYATPQDWAIALRDYLSIRTPSINNLIRCIESLGIVVFLFDFQTRSIDGVTIKGRLDSDLIPPIIFINSVQSGDRMRSTLAHELGHVLMHYTPERPAEKFSDLGTKEIEEEAQEFAGEFLVPEKHLRSRIYSSKLDVGTLSRLKREFGVSMQFLAVRAHKLGIIDDTRYTSLFREFSMRGWRKSEPIEIEKEKPTLAKELIQAHINHLEYSYEDLTKLLAVDYNELAEWYGMKSSKLSLVKINKSSNSIS